MAAAIARGAFLASEVRAVLEKLSTLLHDIPTETSECLLARCVRARARARDRYALNDASRCIDSDSGIPPRIRPKRCEWTKRDERFRDLGIRAIRFLLLSSGFLLSYFYRAFGHSARRSYV